MPQSDSPSKAKRRRLPAPYDGIQVNVCRNTACANFGKLPSLQSTRGRPDLDDGYRVIGSQSVAATILLTCKACNETGSVKSNHAIVEERTRLLRGFDMSAGACPNTDCENNHRDQSTHPDGYYRFGTTRGGTARLRCKVCNRTFAKKGAPPTLRLRQPEKTEVIFRLLMNKSPMRRICEVADIHAMTLYQRIGVIARCATQFVAPFERQLLEGKAFESLHLAVDRQDYVFNWGSNLDRRNVVLRAIASAEGRTGYIFGAHLNYDPDLDPNSIELDARERGDPAIETPFRYYARVWVPHEHEDPIRRMQRYQKAAERTRARGLETKRTAPVIDDVGTDLTPSPGTGDVKIPALGMQIHDDYAMFGHFFYLRELLGGVERLQFSLDQDNTARAACLTAFQAWAKRNALFAFFVRIDKTLKVDDRKARLAQAEADLERLRGQHPDLDDIPLALEVIKRRHRQAVISAPRARDRWVAHPLPNMNEPTKEMCFLTDTGHIDPDRLARAYLRTSLNAVDRFFMQVRRRISLLERPIATSSSNRRLWHGYSGYNPAVASNLITSFRVLYDYCLVGKDHKTPAMRLGLTDQAWTIADILQMMPTPPKRNPRSMRAKP